MKKSFLMLGVAAMALASCTNEEVLNVADSRAISFDNAFVNNSTRAAINSASDLTGFYVFAGFDGNTSNVYSNTYVEKQGDGKWKPEYEAYWQNGKTYTFDAYAANAKIDKAAIGEDGTLTFSNVTISGDNDILVAEELVEEVSVASVGAVPLTFSHTLSQVKFTFKTAIENVNFTITNVTFNNVVNKGNYAASEWTASSASDDKHNYEFEGVSEVVTNDAAEGKSTKSLIILPQTLKADQAVTFDLVATGALSLEKRALKATLTDVELMGGYSYNFVATLTNENIGQPGETLKPIEFTVSEVGKWTDGSGELDGFKEQN